MITISRYEYTLCGAQSDRRLLLATVLGIAATTIAVAQVAGAQEAYSLEPDDPTAVRLGNAVAAQIRIGAVVEARRGPVTNIRIMVAAPLECPEQTVQVVDEDITANVASVEYRMLNDDGARQLLIFIPQLAAGDVARAVVTYDVTTHTQLPPLEIEELTIPQRPPLQLKRYLGKSPMIETKDRRIRTALEEALATLDGEDDSAAEAEDDESPATQGSAASTADLKISKSENPENAEPTQWRRVEAIYNYVRDHVEYLEGDDQSALQTLKLGTGDCQAVAALFVAMCRTAEVPARMVWVDGHQYAEFWLDNPTGQGHWYPMESAGQRAFGQMPVARVILQKGDNFRVPERRRETLRYATDFALFLSRPGQQPNVTYVREQAR